MAHAVTSMAHAVTGMVRVRFVTSPVAGMGIVTHRVPGVIVAVTRMARAVASMPRACFVTSIMLAVLRRVLTVV